MRGEGPHLLAIRDSVFGSGPKIPATVGPRFRRKKRPSVMVFLPHFILSSSWRNCFAHPLLKRKTRLLPINSSPVALFRGRHTFDGAFQGKRTGASSTVTRTGGGGALTGAKKTVSVVLIRRTMFIRSNSHKCRQDLDQGGLRHYNAQFVRKTVFPKSLQRLC